MENSSLISELPLCRLFPIVIYLPNASSDSWPVVEGKITVAALIKTCLDEFDLDLVATFPMVYGGSGILTIFGAPEEPFSAETFWKKHAKLEVALKIISYLGGVPGLVLVAGLLKIGQEPKPITLTPEQLTQLLNAASQDKAAANVKKLFQQSPKSESPADRIKKGKSRRSPPKRVKHSLSPPTPKNSPLFSDVVAQLRGTSRAIATKRDPKERTVSDPE